MRNANSLRPNPFVTPPAEVSIRGLRVNLSSDLDRTIHHYISPLLCMNRNRAQYAAELPLCLLCTTARVMRLPSER
jgi:hypothetical protein